MAAQRVRFTASTPTTIPRIKSGGRMVPLPRADAQGRKGGAASPPPWSECGRGVVEGGAPLGGLAVAETRKWRRISLKTLESELEMAGPTRLTRGSG